MLAIGIVVDDAIVIVENASHHIEQGMAPREATIQAMNEVTGPVIAITLVLMAVFLPTAFLGGITGQLYRQFALTIAATALISAVNALTLKPAQCAAWLRPHAGQERASPASFDAVYRPVERGLRLVASAQLLRVWWLVLLVFVGARGVHRLVVPADADRVPADRGPGVRDHRRAAARRGVAGPDPRGDRSG